MMRSIWTNPYAVNNHVHKVDQLLKRMSFRAPMEPVIRGVMKPLQVVFFGSRTVSVLLGFCSFHNCLVWFCRQGARFAMALAVENDAISAVAQPIEGGCSK